MTAFFVGLDTAIALFKRWRWLILAAPLLIALGIQTLRLNSTRADLLEKQAIISNMKLASEQARAAQVALNEQTTAKYEAAAKEADHEHAMQLDKALAAGERYALSHRVRWNESVASGADTRAKGEGAGIPESAPAEAFMVAVSKSDFDKCSALYPYAAGAYEWGQRLIKDGVGE